MSQSALEVEIEVLCFEICIIFLTLLVAHVQFTSRMNEKLSRLFLLCSHLTLASCLV